LFVVFNDGLFYQTTWGFIRLRRIAPQAILFVIFDDQNHFASLIGRGKAVAPTFVLIKFNIFNDFGTHLDSRAVAETI